MAGFRTLALCAHQGRRGHRRSSDCAQLRRDDVGDSMCVACFPAPVLRLTVRPPSGYDKSVRIWNNKNHTETAKLAHNMPVVAVAWLDRDSGVVTLGDNGIVSTWTRSVRRSLLLHRCFVC